MSDGEATGGEMSDAGKKKRIKIRVGSPSGSRAGTPAPGRAGSIGAGGSRAGSPAIQGQTDQSRAQSPGLGPISVQEVIAAIPASGISSGDLMRSFAGRVGDNPGQTDKKAFFSMVKEHSKYSADKLLRPK